MTTARDTWRYGIWGLQLALVLLVGLFVALGVNGMLSAQLVRATPDAAPVPSPEDAAASSAADDGLRAPSANVLTWNRNLFNQNAEPEAPAPVMPAEPGDPDAAALGDESALEEEPQLPPDPRGKPVETELELTLLGTMVASDPRHSIGHVRTPDNEDLYVRPGNRVPGARVERVAREYVLLRNDERPGGPLEYLSLQGLDGGVAPPGRRVSSVSRAPSMSREVTPMNPPTIAQPAPNRALTAVPEGMVKRDGDHVAIQAEVLEQQNEMSGDLAEAVRMEPMAEGGDVVGMRLGQVEPGTVLGEMGLQSGDVIVSVGGERAADERTAATLFERLAESGELEVEIDRRGERQKIKLTVDR